MKFNKFVHGITHTLSPHTISLWQIRFYSIGTVSIVSLCLSFMFVIVTQRGPKLVQFLLCSHYFLYSSVQARNLMKTHCRVIIVHCMLVRDIARHVEEGFLVGQSFTVLRTFSLLSINPNEDTLESYHCIVILYGKLEWIYA